MPSSESGRIDLGDVTPHNIKLLRKVNQVVFPVSYHDKFYKVSQSIGDYNHYRVSLQDVLDAGELAKLAFFNDIVVGAVCCRVDTSNTGKKVREWNRPIDGMYLYQLLFSVIYHDAGLSGSLQTAWDWNQDVGARPECCER